MTSTSSWVLAALIAWALLLLVLMEVLRVRLVAQVRIASNAFTPDNAALGPFMQRLARAHANCLEGLPIFGGLLVVALLTQRTALTDPWAPALLAARVVQSCVHLASTSVVAVNLRFMAFCVQLAIALRWAWGLVLG